MQTAKEQVAIKDDLLNARHSFYVANAQMPNRLYIGQLDYMNLCRECEVYEIGVGEERECFMGAWIYRVDEDHHIHYARVDSRGTKT